MSLRGISKLQIKRRWKELCELHPSLENLVEHKASLSVSDIKLILNAAGSNNEERKSLARHKGSSQSKEPGTVDRRLKKQLRRNATTSELGTAILSRAFEDASLIDEHIFDDIPELSPPGNAKPEFDSFGADLAQSLAAGKELHDSAKPEFLPPPSYIPVAFSSSTSLPLDSHIGFSPSWGTTPKPLRSFGSSGLTSFSSDVDLFSSM